MKYCTRCNTQVNGGEFCQMCGGPLSEYPTQQNNAGDYNANTNATYSGPVYTTPTQPIPDRPMKWFKFLIYFALFFGALANVVTAVQCLNGNIYGTYNGEPMSEFVYSIFPKMESLNIFYGVALILLAVFQIITRFSLAQYKSSGPMFLYIVYAVATVLSLAYVIACYSIIESVAGETITKAAFDQSQFITQAGMNVAVLAINVSYFSKRKELFVN